MSVSVAPFHFLYRHIVLTEHPNQPGVVLVDVGEREGPDFRYEAIDFVDGVDSGIVHCSQGAKLDNLGNAHKALATLNHLRDSGLFADDVALQLELGIHPRTGDALLFQVRQLAELKRSTFEVPDNLRSTRRLKSKHRTFGVTDPEGLVLSIANGGDRRVLIDFEREHPGVEYVLMPWSITPELQLDECPTAMRGYIVDRKPKPALPHQNTRLVQMALKKDGFALLHTTTLTNDVKHHQKARFFCDGRGLGWEEC